MRLPMGFMAHVFGRSYTFQPPAGDDAGKWVDGRWVPSEPPDPITITATVMPLTWRDLQLYEGGEYTTSDVKVTVDDAVKLPEKSTFEHMGDVYEVRRSRDFSHIGELRFYVGKKLRAIEDDDHDDNGNEGDEP